MGKIEKFKKLWRDMKGTAGFRKAVTYLVFVVIAALFWFILALNDNIQEDFEVKVNIYNVPDSITFITKPPTKIHVSVRDKGTNLWRNGIVGYPQVNLNFREYSADGLMRVSRSELNAAIKDAFGASAALISVSRDSLLLTYTNLPGRRVPIVVETNVSAAVGKIITGNPVVNPKSVTVYSTRDILDTVMRVYTNCIKRSKLEEPTQVSVKIRPIPGVRIEPETATVTINVEPLVRKETNVAITIDNVPEGMDLLLFPSSVAVEYFVPMSRFSSNDAAPEVKVDFRDLQSSRKKLPLRVGRHPKDMMNVTILADSVEYTLVRN